VTYAEYELESGPPWLQGENGARWATGNGLMKDAIAQSAFEAVRAGRLASAPADDVPMQGENRAIEQFAGETTEEYKSRLRETWTLWSQAGTRPVMEAAISSIGYERFAIRESFDWLHGFDQAKWWLFWVIINQPHPFHISFLWGDTTTWGASTWGIAGAADKLLALKQSIRKWKPAHSLCEHIIILISGRLWGEPVYPFARWGDGITWGAEVAFATI